MSFININNDSLFSILLDMSVDGEISKKEIQDFLLALHNWEFDNIILQDGSSKKLTENEKFILNGLFMYLLNLLLENGYSIQSKNDTNFLIRMGYILPTLEENLEGKVLTHDKFNILKISKFNKKSNDDIVLIKGEVEALIEWLTKTFFNN